jgi:Mn-dependent DtxR family transcriptional regulator
MLAIAAGIGLLSGAVGAAISALRADAPAGAVIVLCAGACFVLSMLLSPRRGALARLARHGVQRWRAAREHALRAVLEAGEAMGAAPVAGAAAARLLAPAAAEPFPWVRARDVARRRGWGPTVAALLLWRLSRAGLLERRAGEVRLTPAGAALAVRRARAHRLWERYLVACADRGEWNVDQNADLVEHVLSPDLVARLENALRDVGVDPAGVADLPRSVHPIGAGALARGTQHRAPESDA